jgi:hypothetical protein
MNAWVVIEYIDDMYSEYKDIRKNVDKVFLSEHKAKQYAAEQQHIANQGLRGYSYEVEWCSLDDSVD